MLFPGIEINEYNLILKIGGGKPGKGQGLAQGPTAVAEP